MAAISSALYWWKLAELPEMRAVPPYRPLWREGIPHEKINALLASTDQGKRHSAHLVIQAAQQLLEEQRSRIDELAAALARDKEFLASPLVGLRRTITVICRREGTGVLPREWDRLVDSASIMISRLGGVKRRAGVSASGFLASATRAVRAAVVSLSIAGSPAWCSAGGWGHRGRCGQQPRLVLGGIRQSRPGPGPAVPTQLALRRSS